MPPISEPSRCKGCNKIVVWVEITKADGTKGRLPLDPSAPVYEVDPVNPTTGERTKTAMVSHFATCPKANDFSGGRKG
jgi:hypothetical protein